VVAVKTGMTDAASISDTVKSEASPLDAEGLLEHGVTYPSKLSADEFG